MNRPAFFILFAGSLVLFETLNAASPNMKEGLWEVTAQVDEPKGREAKPTSVKHCISHKDLQNPQKIVPGGDGCEITDHKVKGNVVSWAMVCKGKTPMTGSGSITFSETTYTGQSRLSINRGDRPVQMTVRYNGKYIGPCKK